MPTLLVSRIIPCIAILSEKLPEQNAQMDAVHSVQLQMTKIIAKARLYTAFNRNVLPTANSSLEIGDRDVAISRHWSASHRLTDISNKADSFVCNGRIAIFSIEKRSETINRPLWTTIVTRKTTVVLSFSAVKSQTIISEIASRNKVSPQLLKLIWRLPIISTTSTMTLATRMLLTVTAQSMTR